MISSCGEEDENQEKHHTRNWVMLYMEWIQEKHATHT